MQLPKEDIEHIAKLARLDLTPEELALYGEQLGGILDYVEKLKDAPVGGEVEVSNISGNVNVFHEDEVQESLNRQVVLKNAPISENGFVKVKAVLTESTNE